MWSVGAPYFSARGGNKAYRRVQRSASTAPDAGCTRFAPTTPGKVVGPKEEVSEEVACAAKCSACARVLVAQCCTPFTASRVHMPTQGHSASGYTGTHTRDVRHLACECVVVQREQYALGRCACGVWALLIFPRSGSTAPIPEGTPSAKLGPHTPRSRTRTLRGGPPFVLGLGLTGIPVRLCSEAGHTYSQFC